MSADAPLMGGPPQSARTVVTTVFALCAIFLAGFAFVDLSNQGHHATALSQAYPQIARRTMLYDFALEPLYTSGDEDEEITPYQWVDVHADGYNPDVQNAYNDLPMVRDDIMDPDDFFRGKAVKDMSKSCDKTFNCPEIFNVLDTLPTEYPKNMKNRLPHVPAGDVLGDITLAY